MKGAPAEVTYTIEFEQETDGRWIAEIPAIPGVMVYGATREEATEKVEALAREVVESKDVEFAFA
jgi:predicted RNase H-like HicB family nuclease